MPVQKPSLKARALRYLAAREHSRQELARKLSRYAEADDDIDKLLDWLESSRFLSESRFAESLVNRRAARFGTTRILSELQQHGLDADALSDVKASLSAGESERAWEVWKKKFGQPPATSAESAKQQRFLQQRGFSHTAIQETLRRAQRESSEERVF